MQPITGSDKILDETSESLNSPIEWMKPPPKDAELGREKKIILG